ncbi:hypothetical protein [Natronorubrum bangense]|uniref:Uncharacterized protein n=2 Tax=Natronorubrum bangense TaxID=61858 RepID=L9WK89_9EURY|nr:hypothetical protein [Natronorubrum bangense]ELY49900.1 hypothetical protein C494_07815 [Natronorubrum bangense JCM 10635]QCC55518.1 hypothetical protein DV706_14190 [Natronorubrum bangense]
MEEGPAANVYLLSAKAGVPLAVTQAELTPLQRMVLELSMVKEQEEQEAAMNSAGSGSGSGQLNSMARPNGGGRTETTTYVNVGSDDQE